MHPFEVFAQRRRQLSFAVTRVRSFNRVILRLKKICHRVLVIDAHRSYLFIRRRIFITPRTQRFLTLFTLRPICSET